MKEFGINLPIKLLFSEIWHSLLWYTCTRFPGKPLALIFTVEISSSKLRKVGTFLPTTLHDGTSERP
jgi:hypothetical protein